MKSLTEINELVTFLSQVDEKYFFSEILPKFGNQTYSLSLINSIFNLIKKRSKDIQLSQRQKKTVDDLIKNYSAEALRKRKKYESLGVSPESFVLGMTYDCNLSCKYCYSDSSTFKDIDMDINAASTIIREMNETFGITYITISGGEPFPKVLELAELHENKVFFVYTNGSFIDKMNAQKIKDLGNIIPAISFLGSRKAHENIRGKENYKAVLNAMKYLKDESVIWGLSITESKINYDDIVSGKLFELIDNYKPLVVRMIPYVYSGRKANKLSLTKGERLRVTSAISEAKDTYDYFIFDYVNDKTLGIDCMAGGRRYFYITPDLKITSCVFNENGEQIYYDRQNNRTNTLDLLLNSPLMKKDRRRAELTDGCILLDGITQKKVA